MADAVHLINEHVKLRGRYKQFQSQYVEEEEDPLQENTGRGNSSDVKIDTCQGSTQRGCFKKLKIASFYSATLVETGNRLAILNS